MGLFDFLRLKSAPAPEDRVPALAPLLQAGNNAWQTWPQFYASLRGHADLRVDAVETFVSRYWMKQVAPSREPRLAFLVDADPASWLVVRAQVALAEALEARGSGTEIKDAATFSARAAASRTDAERVAMAEPGEAPPLVMLMRIARGTGDDTLGAQAYRQAVANVPGCFETELAHNSALSQRWGGSHEAQLTHARSVAARAADGTLLAGLPINALFFQMSHLNAFDNDPAGAKAFAAAVQGELSHACLRSLDAPGHVPSVSTFTLRSQAAAIAWQANNTDLLRRQLAALGDLYIASPWSQMSTKPRAEFDALRKANGLA
jgi:hypothetical protein